MTNTSNSLRMVGLVAVVLLLRPTSHAADRSNKSPAKDRPAAMVLFDGKSLAGWKPADYTGSGKVHTKDGAVILERGKQLTGLTYAGKDFPRMDYEVTLESKKLAGDDFFCTTTFPVGDSYCSLVVGGWGGRVVGLSSINGVDASENETNKTREFKRDQWYRIRIRVTKDRIAAWIDDDKLVDVETVDRKISIRVECNACRPFGFCTWNTTGAIRDIRVRTLSKTDIKER